MTPLERELRNLVPTTKSPPWQKLWLAARLELHPGRLNKRLESALSAIQDRMNALGTRYDGAPTAEHHALADAIDELRILQPGRVRLAQPWGEEFLDVLHLQLVALLRGSDDSTVA
jgi:hypothetical protein